MSCSYKISLIYVILWNKLYIYINICSEMMKQIIFSNLSFIHICVHVILHKTCTFFSNGFITKLIRNYCHLLIFFSELPKITLFILMSHWWRFSVDSSINNGYRVLLEQCLNHYRNRPAKFFFQTTLKKGTV